MLRGEAYTYMLIVPSTHILCSCICFTTKHITFSKFVPVALGIQHAMYIRHIVMWPVKLNHVSPHYLINSMIKKN
jgi:hypothetical protein